MCFLVNSGAAGATNEAPQAIFWGYYLLDFNDFQCFKGHLRSFYKHKFGDFEELILSLEQRFSVF